MAKFSCAHPNQSKHTVSFASNYKHTVTTSGRQRVERLWHTEWYLKWGWMPATREVYKGRRELNCN